MVKFVQLSSIIPIDTLWIKWYNTTMIKNERRGTAMMFMRMMEMCMCRRASYKAVPDSLL